MEFVAHSTHRNCQRRRESVEDFLRWKTYWRLLGYFRKFQIFLIFNLNDFGYLRETSWLYVGNLGYFGYRRVASWLLSEVSDFSDIQSEWLRLSSINLVVTSDTYNRSVWVNILVKSSVTSFIFRNLRGYLLESFRSLWNNRLWLRLSSIRSVVISESYKSVRLNISLYNLAKISGNFVILLRKVFRSLWNNILVTSIIFGRRPYAKNLARQSNL